jgi:hypothetical protein
MGDFLPGVESFNFSLQQTGNTMRRALQRRRSE